MACIWIKEALAVKGNQFKLEDVSLNASVSALKAKLSESNGIDEKLHDPDRQLDIIYRGLLLKDDETLESYGLKDDDTVYIISRKPSIVQDAWIELDVDFKDIIPILQTAVASPAYKDKMSALLKNPETLENILATTPALALDPVALTILKDPEILQNLVQSGDISKLGEEHPALVQAASHIAADITKDIAGSSRVRRTSNSEDDDFMDIEPGMLAQAELMAAHEEALQNRPSTRQPITSSLLASALQAARANLVSTSTQTTVTTDNLPSTSTGTTTSQAPPAPQAPPPQRISSEFFNQAMASALNSNANANTTNNWQSELQQLRDMGIEDEALSLRALRATNGNVQAACDLIFEGGLD